MGNPWLSKEVRGCLLEMVLITGRTLGISITSDTIVKYDPTPHGSLTEAADKVATDTEVVVIAVPEATEGQSSAATTIRPASACFPADEEDTHAEVPNKGPRD